MTAPSFGPCMACGPRGRVGNDEDRPVCPRGRPLWCSARRWDDDPRLGEPLCRDCKDYLAHVTWQWHAPELWRRFTIALHRTPAERCGLAVAGFRKRARISYPKVLEFQVHGVIHVHAPIRPDGLDGPDTPPEVPLDAEDLSRAVIEAASKSGTSPALCRRDNGSRCTGAPRSTSAPSSGPRTATPPGARRTRSRWPATWPST